MEMFWATFGFTASTDLDENAEARLERFRRLYNQLEDGLGRDSKCFLQAAAGDDANLEGSRNEVVQAPFVWFGGTFSGTFGGIIGATCATLGAVCAMICSKLCGDVDTVSATVGFVSSVFGGVVGGAFTGAVGGSVNAAALVKDREDYGFFGEVLCFTVGWAIGHGIGRCFGRQVGAAGGAIGGGFGALYATRATVRLSRSLIKYNYKKNPKAEMMRNARGDLDKSFQTLVKELKTIEKTFNNMFSSDAVKVAD